MNARDAYLWTSIILESLRISLAGNGFAEITPAILSGYAEPGARHSVAVMGDKALPTVEARADAVQVRGLWRYYLPVSHAVEKQLALEHLDRVYCLAPCVRLLMDDEDVSQRHLYTFHQVEVELRTESIDEVISLGEAIISESADRVSLYAEKTWGTAASGFSSNLSSVPFPRVAFSDAAHLVGLRGEPRELTLEEEEVLGLKIGRPYWIVAYPEGVRDSLYRYNGRTYDTFDLMLPVRGGELATGGLRPDSAQEVRRQSALVGGRPNEWYADWKERTALQTGGFGIGFERLVRYMAGAESVVEVIPFHDRGPNIRI